MVRLIQIPYADMFAKIKEKSGLSEEELEAKIKAKIDQLSGLVSKEGAAHIIANELGIKLFENSGKIKDVYPGMRNIEVIGKIQQVYELRTFVRKDGAQGQVGNFLIADETGFLRIVCWNEQANILKELEQGAVVKISNAYARDNQGRTEIHLNDQSKCLINPNGIKIDAIKAPETKRKAIKDLAENEDYVEILGTVVQVFDPKFFELCPECNKRVQDEEGEFKCQTHGKVTPRNSFVMNIFLDDGSENIRCVFFKEQALQFLNKTEETMNAVKEAPETFEQYKLEMLGNIVKLSGKVKKNKFFDRLEFVAQKVFLNPNPQEEIARLQNAG